MWVFSVMVVVAPAADEVELDAEDRQPSVTAQLNDRGIYRGEPILTSEGILREFLRPQRYSSPSTDQTSDADISKAAGADSQIKIQGRLHLQYDGFDNDVEQPRHSQLAFRRVRLGAKGRYSNFDANVVAAFGSDDDSTSVEKAIFGWNAASVLHIGAGYTKVPFGYYEVKSSARIKTVERTLANRFFVEGDGLRFAGRHTGLFVQGEVGDEFSYYFALVSPDPSNQRDEIEIERSQSAAPFGRLQWEFGHFTLGADVGFKDGGSAFIGGDGDLFAYGVHAVYDDRLFHVSTEILTTTVRGLGVDGRDASVLGVSLLPALRISDEIELVASGSILDTDSANLLDADDLTRRSNLDSSETGVRYSRGLGYYLGANIFVLGNNLKVSGGYERAVFFTSGDVRSDAQGVRLRVQILL